MVLLALLFLVAPALAAAAIVGPALRQSAACPVVLPIDAAPRVVGGAAASPYIRSHMVSFFYEGCGGSLLSPTWALTAGHCAVEPGSVAFLDGTTSTDGVEVTVKAVHILPTHAFPTDDVKLVQFQSPVPETSNFVYVNANPVIPADGEFARVAGYGYYHEDDDPNRIRALRQVDVPVVSTQQCQEAYRVQDANLTSFIDPAMHICAGYVTGACDSCFADSGGPLFVYANDRSLVQIALVSFGNGCAKEGFYGGYARLSGYVDWMASVGADFKTATTREPVFRDGFAPPPALSPEPDPPAPSSPAPSSPAPSPEGKLKPSPPPTQSDQPTSAAAPTPTAAVAPVGEKGPSPSPRPSPLDTEKQDGPGGGTTIAADGSDGADGLPGEDGGPGEDGADGDDGADGGDGVGGGSGGNGGDSGDGGNGGDGETAANGASGGGSSGNGAVGDNGTSGATPQPTVEDGSNNASAGGKAAGTGGALSGGAIAGIAVGALAAVALLAGLALVVIKRSSSAAADRAAPAAPDDFM